MSNYIDETIISMRKNNSYVRTILDYVVSQSPMLDEQVCLARVLNVLDKKNMAVSKNEVRRAFNKYYNQTFHGEKQGYLNWLYKTFHIKEGTLVNSSNIRSQPTKKRAISQTRADNLGVSSAFNQRFDKRHTNTHLNEIRGLE